MPARFAQLRLRDLMLLEHLEELGSLTEAAARMHVTQSAITQALQSLEEAFGRSLVARRQRGQRGVSLTPAGAAALMHLRIARHELEAALAAAADPGTLELRIGALPLTLVRPLPDALARLRRRLPQVHVHLSEDTVPNLWRQIEAGEFDAIVCRLPVLSEQQRLPEGVAHRTVGHESLVLVCGRGHPVARRRKPALALLGEYDWVLPPEGSYTRLTIEQMFLRAGLKGPRAAITSMNFHANLRLAAEGSLLAVAPRSAALAVREVLDLVLLPIDWGREDTAVTLIWREASLGNPALVALLECF
ncbi:MAG: LysR family transcriptional regulator [Betaproteobacteria bacterium]|nr:LysR family transcriptional regulator [Betaproteobacteria bacterium]